MALASPDNNGKRSAELLVLSLPRDQQRHGYDISKLIQIRSGGALRFHVTSSIPCSIAGGGRGDPGRMVEKAEQRRRRCYSLTPLGRKVLRSKQKSWRGTSSLSSAVLQGLNMHDWKSLVRQRLKPCARGDCGVGTTEESRAAS